MSKQKIQLPVYGAGFAPSWHRPHFRYFAPVEGEGGNGEGGDGKPGGEPGKLFSPEQQAEVNRIVQERVQRAEAKYADYDDLKAKADGAKTLEDRVGTLESELATTRTEAARIRVAAKFGISTDKGAKGEPSDADLLLTGSDEAAMITQAERLAGRVADQKKNGNRAPKEGGTTTGEDKDKDMRAFTSALFASAQTD